ncbi:hypothetical protein [Phenylobacterium sp.]|uniref:hypothetical protein n=1 Tax=Phenylobacterium sp. TaxID=1871053 RepID=UPI00286B657D|nr:hypothetical protein [Phenylobacterium sp.]
MKTTLLIAASALALSACGSGGARAVAKLTCPSTEGDLTRVSASADGKSCAYRSSDGAEVTLELVAVQGDVQATLDGIEAALRSKPGPLSLEAKQTQAQVGAAIADAEAAKARLGSVAAEVARVQAEAAADAGVSVRAGAIGVGTVDAADGEVTRVDLPGIHINTRGEQANVRIGALRVDANDEDTTVKIFRDVRLRGEALAREKRGVRATFIYTGKDLPSGYRYVGYEAGGPKAGPLTVAKVKSKVDTESGDNIYHDVQDLVRRNGGV